MVAVELSLFLMAMNVLLSSAVSHSAVYKCRILSPSRSVMVKVFRSSRSNICKIGN